jgi:hypothetical protein
MPHPAFLKRITEFDKGGSIMKHFSKVLLENERVKVQESRSRPGDKSQMIERSDRVQYFIKGGVFKRHSPDGKTEDVKVKAGEVMWRQRGAARLENVGKTEARWIAVFLKQRKKK